jgi:3-oxoacyl-[acyl-carrier-protein] synthase II
MPAHHVSTSVVVTGIGLWTGLGTGRDNTWQALQAGQSALRWIDVPGTHGLGRLAGAPRAEADGDAAAEPDDRTLSLVFRTAREAMDDARLTRDAYLPERIATVIGLSKGCLQRLGRLAREGVPGTAAFPDFGWPNAGAALLAAREDLRGPCLAPVAACATGLIAALQAADLIRRGVCDLALAGAADASLDPLVLGAFHKMGVLARIDGDPARAVRPWDRRRSGFLVGEGAAVLVLERADRARQRGVPPYAELAGGAFGADAYHETNLDPDPVGLATLLRRALANAHVAPSEVDLVNVHGTATPTNDPLECRAIRGALGEAAGHVSCSANKSQIGHLLGAAGAVELALTCLSLRDGFVPPTLNLDEPDPACDLDATAHVGRRRPIRAALKLSIGFGGHLAAALVRQPERE